MSAHCDKHGCDLREIRWQEYKCGCCKLEAEIGRLREALRAMLPGRLGSELEYQTNALYHACVHIARASLGEKS